MMRMKTRPLSAVLALALFGAVACGGDDAKDANKSPAAVVESPTPTPDSVLPAPKARAETDVVLVVGTRKKTYEPTLAEFKSLPKSEIDAGGKRTGVSLAALAAKVDGVTAGFVTVEGRTTDLKRQTVYRGALKDAGSSVLVIDEKGIITFYSPGLPKDQFITVVESVSFE